MVHIAAHQGNLECLKVFAGLQNAMEILKVQDKVNANPHALLGKFPKIRPLRANTLPPL